MGCTKIFSNFFLGWGGVRNFFRNSWGAQKYFGKFCFWGGVRKQILIFKKCSHPPVPIKNGSPLRPEKSCKILTRYPPPPLMWIEISHFYRFLSVKLTPLNSLELHIFRILQHFLGRVRVEAPPKTARLGLGGCKLGVVLYSVEWNIIEQCLP